MIRVRLLIGFILVALLPVLGVGIGTYIVSYQNGRQQSIDRLESIAARKELAIQVWVKSLQQELQVAAQTDYSPKLVSNALKLSNENTPYGWYNNLVRKRLQFFVDQSSQFKELFLVNLQGKVAVSTNLERENKNYGEFIFNAPALSSPYTQLPFLQKKEATADDSASIFVLMPVNASDGSFVGAIGGKVDVNALSGILNEQTGLGATGQTYLVNADHALLARTKFSNAQNELRFIQTGGVDSAIRQESNFAGIYANPLGVSVVGIYRWLPDLKVVLVVEQNSSEAFQAVSANTTVNLVIALIALALAIFAALFMTQNIANPIVELAQTASHIAQGNLEPVAKVVREDEVGALARAFNTMTGQLRDSINSLELRVQERTSDLKEANKALEQRALQLEISAQVGREITSILDIDVLLYRIVELIQGAFGYYHVQVLLLDNEMRQLIISAGSGSREVQYPRIDLGRKSINVEAAQTGRIQVVNDVSQNPNFLFDNQLPQTRSEVSAPLKIGERVIGTLDVHASTVNAFSEEDTLVIQSLGDQIAVAIENARLYEKSKRVAVLEERNRLSRELHDSVTQSLYSLVLFTEGWRRMLKGNRNKKVEEYLNRINDVSQQTLKEMRLLILELRPPVLEQEGLVGALKRRLDAVEKKVGINARVVMEEFIEFKPEVAEALYWVSQEALNNSLKHARAALEVVRIYVEGRSVILEISDDGQGFDPDTVPQSSMGLVNMRERVRQIGGTLTIRSKMGKGTIIKASVPLSDSHGNGI